MNPETLRVPFVEVQASVLEELQRKAAAYDALNQRQAVKAEPAIEALSMIGEVLGLDEDDAGPTPIIDKIVCLQEAFETVKRLHLIATNQVVDLRKAAKPEPLSAAQGVPEGWQPIETAPKDGTVIIALQCWIYHTDAALRPHYVLHEVFFNDDGGWEVVEDGEILDEDSLTHWLPRTRLPAAPE